METTILRETGVFNGLQAAENACDQSAAAAFFAAGFLAAVFLAGALFAAGFLAAAAFGAAFFAGAFLPLGAAAARAARRGRASSSVRASGAVPLGRVALILPD